MATFVKPHNANISLLKYLKCSFVQRCTSSYSNHGQTIWHHHFCRSQSCSASDIQSRVKSKADSILNRSRLKADCLPSLVIRKNFFSSFNKPYHVCTKLKWKTLNSFDYHNDQSAKHLSSSQNKYLQHILDAHDSKSLVHRFLFVKTLKDFYEDVPSGVVMDTAYADSRPSEDFDKSMPVVVGLHDTPGTHRDLVPLLEFFAKLGCRAVCPTLPGHGQTKGVMRGHDDIFSQSTLERATFVNDFLANLDIERVDVLIGVGASCYTAMALCTLQPKIFKTMALISPWPMTKRRFIPNYQLANRIRSAWDARFLRLPLHLLLRTLQLGNAKSVQEKITLAYLLSGLDFGEIQSYGMAVGFKKVPHIVAYGGEDEEVDQSSYHEVLEMLEIKSSAVTKFDGVLKNFSIPGALVFPDSDYDILTRQRGVLCACLLTLLQRLHPHIKV